MRCFSGNASTAPANQRGAIPLDQHLIHAQFARRKLDRRCVIFGRRGVERNFHLPVARVSNPIERQIRGDAERATW